MAGKNARTGSLDIVEYLIPRATEFEPNSGRIPGFTHNQVPHIKVCAYTCWLYEIISLYLALEDSWLKKPRSWETCVIPRALTSWKCPDVKPVVEATFYLKITFQRKWRWQSEDIHTNCKEIILFYSAQLLTIPSSLQNHPFCLEVIMVWQLKGLKNELCIPNNTLFLWFYPYEKFKMCHNKHLL